MNISSATTVKHRPAHRRDLHGLRGLAVLLVVIYHVFVGKVSGGVDVFLFLSAYFLTGTFMRQLSARRLPHAPRYWLLAFKRLLPPALTVILLTYLAVYALLPSGTHIAFLQDAIYAALQLENWWLIAQNTDYYALDRTAASPYQQFWSLAIQSQIFLLWPLLFLLAGLLLRLTLSRRATASQLRARSYTLVFLIFTVIAYASFSWSVYSTGLQQEIAYFDTFARAWEFALGTLLALLFPIHGKAREFTRRNKIVRGTVSLTGVIALVSLGAVLDVATSFPGWIALLPLGAAGLVIAAGVNPLLETRTLQFFGDISYAFYLVHWPVLVVTLTLLERPMAGKLTGALIFVVSVLLAWLLTKLVDNPFRRLRLTQLRGWAGQLTIASWLAGALAVLLSTQALFLAQQQQRLRLAAEISPAHPGALIFDTAYQRDAAAEAAAAPIPVASDLSTEWWALPQHCAELFTLPESIAEFCSARWQSQHDRSPHIFYWGNSRLEQLSAGIDELAAQRGWKASAVLIGGCAPGFNVEDICAEHTANTLAHILAARPDAVVMQTSFVAEGDVAQETTSAAVRNIVQQLTDANIRVVGLRDHARLQVSPTNCFETNAEAECSEEVTSQFTAARPDQQLLTAELVYGLDFNNQICPDGLCVPVIGNTHVFLDANHITKTYSRTLQYLVAAELDSQEFKW